MTKKKYIYQTKKEGNEQNMARVTENYLATVGMDSVARLYDWPNVRST